MSGSEPYDPYIPNGGDGAGESRHPSNPKTAELQSVGFLFLYVAPRNLQDNQKATCDGLAKPSAAQTVTVKHHHRPHPRTGHCLTNNHLVPTSKLAHNFSEDWRAPIA